MVVGEGLPSGPPRDERGSPSGDPAFPSSFKTEGGFSFFEHFPRIPLSYPPFGIRLLHTFHESFPSIVSGLSSTFTGGFALRAAIFLFPNPESVNEEGILLAVGLD